MKTMNIKITITIIALAIASAQAGGEIIGYIRGHEYGPIDLYRDDAVRAKVNRAIESAEGMDGTAMEERGELIVVDARTKVQVLVTKPDPQWGKAAQVLVLEGEQKGKTGWWDARHIGNCRTCVDWHSVIK
jgi:hypothetical protein